MVDDGGLDLLRRPVIFKGKECSYIEYINGVKSKQEMFLSQLNDDSFQWNIPDELQAKVSSQGKMQGFYGDTIVYPFNEKQINTYFQIQKEILSQVDFLAEPLDVNSFHITIHDLVNGKDQNVLKNEMKENTKQVERIFTRLRSYLERFPEHSQVKLEATYYYPSFRTTFLLGFIPVDDYNFRKLINVYNLFEEVKYLDYWFRPHLTFAYFKPVKPSHQQIKNLWQIFDRLNPPKLYIDMDLNDIAYQHFEHMNDYKNIYQVRSNK